MLKKLLSVILSVLIVVSVFSSFSAFATEDETEILGPGAEDKNLPEVAEGYNRYFFYMPEFWLNEYTDTAGIYWWKGTDACSAWPGYAANKADVVGVYYCDVPTDVTTIVWSNFFDGGADTSAPNYKDAIQTRNIGTEYYDPGESESYPDGIESFDGMIYVISGIDMSISDFSVDTLFWSGEWYYYYGNGEYGITPTRGDGEIYTDEVLVKDGFLLPPFAGDTDENGVVNIKDATHLQKLIAGMDVDDVWEPVGDVDDSGDINIKDATAIQKYLAGIETGCKIGKYVVY